MKIPKSNFSEWYNEVLEACDIIDIRYPVKGMPVYRPWGFGIMKRCFEQLERLLDESGHEQAYFPILVPDDQFGKEAEHIKGFGGDVLWVTHGGNEPLERKLAMRPTSETIMYPMFSLWVRSHADLPLRIHQTVCVYRHETKATKPLMRGREVYWNEAHTVHATEEDCEMQIGEAVRIYKKFFELLSIPAMILKRPSYDTFPGANYSIAFDLLMPDGKTLQAGTVHNLGNKFSKVYDITYTDAHGAKHEVHQTCYGISMRCLASVIAVHGDDKGIVLPSLVAPVQAVIVPILFGDAKEALLTECKSLEELLASNCIRTHVDARELRPGEKYYHWEARGVPMHIELGPKELAAKKLVLVTRDGEKRTVDEEKVVEEARAMLAAQDARLLERARKHLQENQRSADSLKKLKETMAGKGGFVKIGWCGEEKCAEKVEIEGSADIMGSEHRKLESLKCIACGKPGDAVWAAKAY